MRGECGEIAGRLREIERGALVSGWRTGRRRPAAAATGGGVDRRRWGGMVGGESGGGGVGGHARAR
jgi:hypothetical protein